MPQRTIAIGDVHGCSRALQKLILLVSPTPSDTIVLLGDCIDRGPNSRGVLQLLLELSDTCRVVAITGNHEEMLLAAVDRPGTASLWLECGGRQTLQSYGVDAAKDLPREHLLYMRTWLDYWETNTHFFAHANYAPHTSLEDQEWGYQRWKSLKESMPPPHLTKKIAVVGHTSQKSGEILQQPHLLCIDTYCHGGKWLTAYDTESGEIWQADLQGNARSS